MSNKVEASIYLDEKISTGQPLWADVSVAMFSAILFSVLLVLSYVSYFRQFLLSPFILCLGICLLIRLRSCRQAVTRKRDRRMLLPLSM